MNGERAALKPIEARAKILVASDSPSDAALVKKLLAQEFEQVFLSTNPDQAVTPVTLSPGERICLNTYNPLKRWVLGGFVILLLAQRCLSRQIGLDDCC